ncbi:MAG: hypothetical protein JWL76_1857 [Thermoleophilia bacterium]|nr:hypothetical protein [Thermoleophilia bacterium]
MLRSPGECRGSVAIPDSLGTSDQAARVRDDQLPMTQPRHIRSQQRRLAGVLVLLLMLGSLLVPSLASAACSATVRADSRATALVVDEMRTAGAPGAADVADLYARGRRSCIDVRPVRSIAVATQRLGLPAAGRRATVRGVPLVGTTLGTGTVWRLDLKQVAVRVAKTANRVRVTADVTLLRSAAGGSSALTYSPDPTRTAWDPKVQALVSTILGTSAYPDARALGDTGIRAFAVRGRIAALGALPLLEHLLIANRVAAVGARSGVAAVDATSATIAVRAMVRIRAARARGWSRIDGAWSSGPAHRALVAQATVLLQRHPHAATDRVVDDLRAALRTPAKVDFGTLPVAAFYPWPRDGAFDTQAVTLDVNKPGTVSLLVYGAAATPIRTVSATTDPGVVTLTWDGADASGAIQPAGDYRYNIDVVDPVGNRVRAPGLERFRVARDTTPPTVQTATARVIGTGTGRRIVASWAVTEEFSPKVTTWLLLANGARTERIQLHGSLQRATVRKPITLAAGSWKATLVFGDGSGNRVSRSAGSFEIRAGTS